eukprot:6206015-Pleurochrysis_carterae.AAC.3
MRMNVLAASLMISRTSVWQMNHTFAASGLCSHENSYTRAKKQWTTEYERFILRASYGHETSYHEHHPIIRMSCLRRETASRVFEKYLTRMGPRASFGINLGTSVR